MDLTGPFGTYNPPLGTFDKAWEENSQHLLHNLPSEPVAFPDFMVIGPGKSGTTWLYNSLSRCSDIKRKESHYFTFGWQEDGLEQYSQQFKCPDDLIRGDFTPWYCLLPR